MNKGAMIVKMNEEALKRFKQKRRRQAEVE